jgi:hypothetical protein
MCKSFVGVGTSRVASLRLFVCPSTRTAGLCGLFVSNKRIKLYKTLLFRLFEIKKVADVGRKPRKP